MGAQRCKCRDGKHVRGCPSRRGPKLVPIGSVGFNVLSALAICPLTFDAIKKRVVDDFTYADEPGLRRRLACAVYEMCRHGYAARRGEHDSSSFAKHRRWQITPAGRDAIEASMVRYAESTGIDADRIRIEDAALSACVEGDCT